MSIKQDNRLRTYHELILLETFEERFEYLKLSGRVGADTFGFDRYLNQDFYRSQEWKRVRREVIVRDFGRDLAIPGREMESGIQIHHMNPIGPEDILEHSDRLLNPEYLICVSAITHKAIHYGDSESIMRDPIVRKPGDTCLWKTTERRQTHEHEHSGQY